MPYLSDDGLVAPPAPWPGSVSGPHWLAAAPRTPSLLSQACPGVVLSPPPIWHIAGLSPRACERGVGGLWDGGGRRGEFTSECFRRGLRSCPGLLPAISCPSYEMKLHCKTSRRQLAERFKAFVISMAFKVPTYIWLDSFKTYVGIYKLTFDPTAAKW